MRGDMRSTHPQHLWMNRIGLDNTVIIRIRLSKVKPDLPGRQVPEMNLYLFPPQKIAKMMCNVTVDGLSLPPQILRIQR